MTRWALVLGIAMVTACGKGAGAGADGQPCYGNGTCNAGLRCEAGTCRPPPPADCGPVAEALASLELGNYAPVEQRAPKVAEARALCERARLTEAEAACLVAARSDYAAAACPRPLLPRLAALGRPDCPAVSARLKRVLDTQLAGSNLPPAVTSIAPALLAAIQRSCEVDHWPPAAHACILESPLDTRASFARCLDEIPRDVRDRLEQTMRTLVTRGLGGEAPSMPEVAADSPCARMQQRYAQVLGCVPIGMRLGLTGGVGALVRSLGDDQPAMCAQVTATLDSLGAGFGC
ncbi:MAG: hypothetical protein R2939_22045 [Kofleriaceae bacterium]